ncbi:MAG: MBL fold metallo-hydrolase [Chloroflexi bacterium]|nr:MBL fold metallo-hydrolase [Chloroflexota bacterium]
MSERFTVKFWGVRGSYPAPGKNTVRFGGNTSCVEVRAGKHIIILDAGTGIIPLGQELARAKQLNATILLSHLHHDHTQGFPFFVPAYIPSAQLHIFGPTTAAETLDLNQSPRTFPIGLNDMNATKEIRSLRETDTLTFDSTGVRINASSSDPETATVKIYRSYAHPGGVHVYRIDYRGRSLVYATDTEGYVGGDRKLAAFARGADLLIHDAQYSEEHYRGQIANLPSTQGYGHSTPQMACQLANAAGVRELALFHHDPNYADETVAGLEVRARSVFPNVCAAYEGLVISLTPTPLPVGEGRGVRAERAG